ncbi:class I SAM-dependent methyltransferase [Cohaesibacter gelatinilyticus]|uniref:23S rRNA (Cytosine1962-C5)-methyltransferase n=1 Tax=Cohaesibacter gelatinilyticus TaxID=372072 RepID=A0A285PL37_9HYPH|nr:class I SAM-dependent methyltransferase [Cohaesibacter gelatinilyticus]SNZ20581.1 23S rRNA (cytosine1962-C5)-methyltransferase [Cohaesibacter gelatinilyticus]
MATNRRGGRPQKPGSKRDGGKPAGGRGPARAAKPHANRSSDRSSDKREFTPGRIARQGGRKDAPAKPFKEQEAREPFVLPPRPQGPVPKRAPFQLMVTEPWDHYALIDMGHGRKLERYGPYHLIRPEPQAMGSPRLATDVWDGADAIFSGDLEEEGPGRWKYPTPLAETWPTHWDDIGFHGRFTAFRHVGFFPEQAAHWAWMENQLKKAYLGRPPKVLNLFGYSGVASLVAARAGAEVTHVDASKKAVAYGKENQLLAGLEGKPIRWIVDDAMKFVQREIRRGNQYDGILLDPPKFGRGPKGEVWQLFEMLPEMLDACRQILSPQAQFFTLTAYAMRASFAAFDELMIEVMTGQGGVVETGELMIACENNERRLATSIFSRWRPLEQSDEKNELQSDNRDEQGD